MFNLKRKRLNTEEYNALKSRYSVLLNPDRWPFAFVYAPSYRISEIKYIRLFFWLPFLVLTQVIFICLTKNNQLLYFSVSLLWLNITIMSIQNIISRLLLGNIDYYFRHLTITYKEIESDLLSIHKGQVVRYHMLIIIGLVITVLLGYTGIYVGINKMQFGFAFSNVPQNDWTPLYMLYFSIVTFSTVGYGDILPASKLAHAFVSCEILNSLALLILLITNFSLTVDPLEDINS
jgi:hypothetical protein